VVIILVANKIDLVEDDDRQKGYGRFAQQDMRRCFSDPEIQKSNRQYQQQDFSAKKSSSNMPQRERRNSLANDVRESSPA
jgi:hypothetical protein